MEKYYHHVFLGRLRAQSKVFIQLTVTAQVFIDYHSIQLSRQSCYLTSSPGSTLIKKVSLASVKTVCAVKTESNRMLKQMVQLQEGKLEICRSFTSFSGDIWIGSTRKITQDFFTLIAFTNNSHGTKKIYILSVIVVDLSQIYVNAIARFRNEVGHNTVGMKNSC